MVNEQIPTTSLSTVLAQTQVSIPQGVLVSHLREQCRHSVRLVELTTWYRSMLYKSSRFKLQPTRRSLVAHQELKFRFSPDPGPTDFTELSLNTFAMTLLTLTIGLQTGVD